MSWKSHEDMNTVGEKRWREILCDQTVNLGQIRTLCMAPTASINTWTMMVQNLSFRKEISHRMFCMHNMRDYPSKYNETMQSAPQNTLAVTHALWRCVLMPCCESPMFCSILVTANESLPTDPNATECAKSQIHHHRTHKQVCCLITGTRFPWGKIILVNNTVSQPIFHHSYQILMDTINSHPDQHCFTD